MYGDVTRKPRFTWEVVSFVGIAGEACVYVGSALAEALFGL